MVTPWFPNLEQPLPDSMLDRIVTGTTRSTLVLTMRCLRQDRKTVVETAMHLNSRDGQGVKWNDPCRSASRELSSNCWSGACQAAPWLCLPRVSPIFFLHKPSELSRVGHRQPAQCLVASCVFDLETPLTSEEEFFPSPPESPVALRRLQVHVIQGCQNV